MIKKRKLEQMVGEIEKHVELNELTKKAFLAIDREVFVPDAFSHLAYQLDALPLHESQWISSPITVAKMTEHLELEGVDTILEIGCGSGYQAAILSAIVRRVFTIERIDSLLKSAKSRFSQLEIYNIFTRFDDGQRGWGDYAPFERILFSAATPKIPETLFEQLSDGGILIAPIQEGPVQILTRFYKRGSAITSESIETCYFVPVLEGTKK
ncbi:MAG: protein-L-isoaspartate(D-aspartate) O-methyltransferase [Campylobacterales bacterium]|nr:protein-L-isoaspartate(D-aspartate) O-methyltransferase [Campylobacterales bacterium]